MRFPRATRLIIAFGRKEEAEQVYEWLVNRLGEWGLELHPDKTRLVDFRRPPSDQSGGKGPGTFDFLGFTVLWSRSRHGNWYLATHTRMARLRNAKKAINQWCKRHRHRSVEEQHAALVRRLQGHLNYFDVRGNVRRVRLLIRDTERSWHKWLNRRSQRSTMSWKRFKNLLRVYPLPVPKSQKVLWATAM